MFSLQLRNSIFCFTLYKNKSLALKYLSKFDVISLVVIIFADSFLVKA